MTRTKVTFFEDKARKAGSVALKGGDMLGRAIDKTASLTGKAIVKTVSLGDKAITYRRNAVDQGAFDRTLELVMSDRLSGPEMDMVMQMITESRERRQ